MLYMVVYGRLPFHLSSHTLHIYIYPFIHLTSSRVYFDFLITFRNTRCAYNAYTYLVSTYCYIIDINVCLRLQSNRIYIPNIILYKLHTFISTRFSPLPVDTISHRLQRI